VVYYILGKANKSLRQPSPLKFDYQTIPLQWIQQMNLIF